MSTVCVIELYYDMSVYIDINCMVFEADKWMKCG